MIPKSLLAFAALSVSVLPSAWAAVLAIDYGTDWTKASLMKPGLPFDVLLNKDSKRKIHSSIGWNRGDRLFSTDALNIGTRFPQDSFPSLKHILGGQYTSNKTTYYTQIAHGVLMDTDRGTVEIGRKGDSAPWSVEELVGMQLAYIRGLAEDVAGERVTEVVLTVPAFFSHIQRQAILDAVEIAGMKTLALLNDGSAVAINYAMTRSFPEKEHHIIYDAGAGSIRATVASFHSPDAKPVTEAKKKASKTKSPSKESVNVEILGYGYDTTATGNELTLRLKDLFVEQFETKHKASLARDTRALARLWKEAERVKGILSANADSRSTVESLHDDIDFKTTTSRTEFEALAEDLKPLFAAPIVAALESSGLTWDNITSVIFMGGHSRVPMVQAAVRSAVGETSISQNINTDEAAVLGAAFYAASLSPQFRTKKIKLQDVATRDIQVSYEAEGKSGKRTINNKIFPKISSKLGVKKTLTFKRKEDFAITLSYNTAEETPEFPRQILKADIANVETALANLTSRGAVDPVVKVTLQLNENGQVTVTDAIAYGEVKDDSLTGKLKNLFGGGASSSSSSETPDSTDSASSSGSPSSSTATPSETPASEAKKAEKNSVPLVVETTYLSVRSLTTEEKSKSRGRLQALDAAERAQEAREEAVNLLEAYIYRLRDILAEAESGETIFKEFSTEEERVAIRTLLEETAEWLITIDLDVTTETLRAKKAALEALENPIQGRHKEYKAIPDAIKDLRKAIDASRLFYHNALNEVEGLVNKKRDENVEEGADPEEPSPLSRFTAEEVEEIDKAIKEVEDWLTEKIDSVGGAPKNVDVPFHAADVDQKGITLQRKVLRLSNRPKPQPKPKKKAKTTSTSSESATSTSTGAEETETVKRYEL